MQGRKQEKASCVEEAIQAKPRRPETRRTDARGGRVAVALFWHVWHWEGRKAEEENLEDTRNSASAFTTSCNDQVHSRLWRCRQRHREGGHRCATGLPLSTSHRTSVQATLVASSTGLLLKTTGLKVTAIKIDPYMNIDAGTMRPQEHGEILVRKTRVLRTP